MNFLFRKIDNSQLAIFRILYGIILFVECAGAIAVGWTREVFDVPKFTFNFIGFEFLQPPSLNFMYGVYAFMALLGILMAIGYRYRLSALLMALSWTCVYLMHKVHYNNHHYLMFLLNWMMVFVPAHHYRSMDVKQGRVEERGWCYQWNVSIFVFLLFVAYTYAAVAKMNPDWIRAVPLKTWLGAKAGMPVIGWIYKSEITAYFMAWGGLVFDLFVIPALLWKRTRVAAFFIGVFFHLSNSITFQIGTFPYTMIASGVLFFPKDYIRRLFFKSKQFFETKPYQTHSNSNAKLKWVFFCLIFFATSQVLLPLRHHLIEDNVFWTEEGHRLSWRMMLRAKSGSISFRIVKEDGDVLYHPAQNDVTKWQYRLLQVKPDIMWQYIQHLKKEYGPGAKIYVNSRVKLNDHPMRNFIDPSVDMAKAKWNYFGHADWIMPFDGWENIEEKNSD